MVNPAAEFKHISRGFAHGPTCLDMISPDASPIHAAAGTPVSAGEPLGKVGHIGGAEGSHVHFDVRIAGRPVDPRQLAPCNGVTDASPIEEAEVPAPRVRRRPQRKAQQ